MVAFAPNAELLQESIPRAGAQDRRCLSSAAHCSNINRAFILRISTHADRTRLGTRSRDPIGYEKVAWNLYAGYFAAKLVVDPSGIYWIMPWHPDAQWRWPFDSFPGIGNPYTPPPTINPGPIPTGIPPWLVTLLKTPAPILAGCLAGAVAAVVGHELVDLITGEPFDLTDLQTKLAAVIGCMHGACIGGGVSIGVTHPVLGVCAAVGCVAIVQGICAYYDGNGIPSDEVPWQCAGRWFHSIF